MTEVNATERLSYGHVTMFLLGHWDNGGLLKAGGDYSVEQGQIEDVQHTL
jgi:hypothetical protein